jgi:hypothetical protein
MDMALMCFVIVWYSPEALSDNVSSDDLLKKADRSHPDPGRTLA